MSRDMTAAMQSAVEARVVYPAALLELEFDSGTTRIWTGYGPLSWDGKTWQGAGELLSLSPAQESTEVRAEAATAELSGIPSAYISLALQEDYQGRQATQYLALLDGDGNIIADPVQTFSGRMDQMQISEDGQSSIIRLGLESHLIDLKTPREFRYTDQDQRIDYPNDRAFEYIAGLQDKRLSWGPDNRSDEQRAKDLAKRRGDVRLETRTRSTDKWKYRERVAVDTDTGEVLERYTESRSRPEDFSHHNDRGGGGRNRSAFRSRGTVGQSGRGSPSSGSTPGGSSRGGRLA